MAVDRSYVLSPKAPEMPKRPRTALKRAVKSFLLLVGLRGWVRFFYDFDGQYLEVMGQIMKLDADTFEVHGHSSGFGLFSYSKMRLNYLTEATKEQVSRQLFHVMDVNEAHYFGFSTLPGLPEEELNNGKLYGP